MNNLHASIEEEFACVHSKVGEPAGNNATPELFHKVSPFNGERALAADSEAF